MGLAKALEQAGRSSIASQEPLPKAIKKPKYARARPGTIPRIMSETESDSDSTPSAPPAPRPKPPAKTLPLPRTNTLKRPRPEESGDTDKPGSRTTAVASSGSAKANKSMDLGPVPKKAKNPPGIPVAELAAHMEAVATARAKRADKIPSTDTRKAKRIEPPPPPHARPPNALPPNVPSPETDAAAVTASQAVSIAQAPKPAVSTGPAPAPVPVPAPPTGSSVDAASPQAPTSPHVAAPALAVQHSLQPTISTAVVPVPHPPSAASTSLGPAMDIDPGTSDVGPRLLMLQHMMNTVSTGFSSVVQDLCQSLPDRATYDQMFNRLSQRLDALEVKNSQLAAENIKLREDVILLADANGTLQGQHKHTVSQLESLKQEMVELRGLHSAEMSTRCNMSFKMEETSKGLEKLYAMFYETAHAQARAQAQAGVDASSPSFSPVTPVGPEHAKVGPHGWPTVSQLGGKAPSRQRKSMRRTVDL
ncbi:hypothetical protein BD413DRAFT_17010 [Trametes elegans]|nr:hypothetical protein BD413DRAFT_17010 [Trametes elegans]